MAKIICVFCGAHAKGKKYLDVGTSLGTAMAKASWDLVYGGAQDSVMGAVADAVLASGAKAYGVIPKRLIDNELEVAHGSLTRLYVVDSLHERKKKMYDMADVFVALPGGFGTLDELCEVLTWAKLGYHRLPIFLLNFEGFYDRFIDHLTFLRREGFVKDGDLSLLNIVGSVDELLDRL